MLFGPTVVNAVVIKVAVQEVVLVPAAHVTRAPRGAEPFMNCTVPPGGATFIAAATTVAVSVTLPPEAIDVGLAVTVVVVAAVTVTVAAADGPEPT